MTVSKFKRGQNIRVITVDYKSEMSNLKTTVFLATDLCLSWPKVLNLVTVRGFMKTPVY